MRSYRIDIETDSTIAEDAQLEKQSRIELVTAITAFMEKVGPMVQAQVIPTNVATELLGFAVRGFKVGRTLEDTLDEMSQSDDDPKAQQIQQQFQMAQQQMQAQMQEQVEGIKQEADKEIKGLQNQLFKERETNAISKAVNEAKMFETSVKGEIEQTKNENQMKMDLFLAMVKEQIQAQQTIPVERVDELGNAMNQFAQIVQQQDQNYMQIFEAMQQQIDEAKGEVSGVKDLMMKPAKAVKQKDGSWIASREG
jgi:hypothetical protein